jgi:SAM-dependent methyltransferase
MVDDPVASFASDATPERMGGRAVHYHRFPRSRGYGGARKAAFEYAREAGLDHAITMRADGSHPPERLPELIHACLKAPRDLVIGVASGGLRGVLRSDGPLAVRLSRWAALVFQRRVLGMRMTGFRSGFRAYPRPALERIPYQLNSDDETFELEMVLQFRALGAQILEVEFEPPPRGVAAEQAYLLRDCATSVGYRLHQLHVTQDGRYLIARDVRYTLKQSETGSHMQIVAAIRSGARVLDLGCSQGLLAAPLREKGVRVVGVDHRDPGELAEELEGFYQRDLERPLELPVQREFDYVVVADVIEHVANRQGLLRTARKFLKPDGRLIISTPNIAIWFYRISLLVGRFEYGPRGILDETHVHLYTGASFRREVERAGFRVVEQRVTALPFEVVFESTGRSNLMRKLASSYHAIARLWPSMFAYQTILSAEITTLDDESIQ